MAASNLGALIDALYKLRAKRQAAQKSVDALASQEEETSLAIRGELRKAGLDSGRGKIATATITHKTVAMVEDWPALWAWVKKNNAFDILQRRIGMEALAERLEAGQRIPVKTERVEKLSLTKVTPKS